MNKYITDFGYKSIETNDFKNHFVTYFSADPEVEPRLKSVDWEHWLHGEGMGLPDAQ